jgi:SAM-dependent methyltransferase
LSESFDRYASAYQAEIERAIAFAGQPHDRYVRAKAQRLLALAKRRLGPASLTSALDVGCGGGLTVQHLRGAVPELNGVDVSEEMLARARARVPEASFQLYGGDRLPYADGTFDLVFAVCVLHHVEPAGRAALLAEMVRVTRRSGFVAVFEHNPLNPLTRKVVRSISFDVGVRLLKRGEVVVGLTKAGVVVTDTEYLLFTPWGALDPLEALVTWLPVGAQHLVAGIVP